jgi:ABC-type dipeptide/oligopeptide/nickel transport system permease subunit
MLLAIALSAVLGVGLDKCIIALGISGIPGFARMMRANILTIRNLEYIEASTSINCSTFRIIRRHIIPNAFSPLIVQISMSIAGAGLAAAGLSFIGLGVQPPRPEWGAMLASARNRIRDYPHMVIIPGVFIMITVLSFNIIGDAIRDALDPKLKN